MIQNPDFYSIGSIIIDDIVLPDGRTQMQVLGGGGTHAIMGMRIWSERVGILAAVGEDLPESYKHQIEVYFNHQGMLIRRTQTPRAWQVYEMDGTRTEVFRTEFQSFLEDSPRPGELPEAYQSAKGVHLQASTPEPLSAWLLFLTEIDCKWILWEPWDIYCQPENREEIRAFLALTDIFSPNLSEARRLTGYLDPVEIAMDLLADGVSVVAIRMGASGSLIADRDGTIQLIPAVPAGSLVDETGAGNAYCGGFLVGMAQTGDPVMAGQMGSVSASFALEQFGAIYPLDGIQLRAEQRLRLLIDQCSI